MLQLFFWQPTQLPLLSISIVTTTQCGTMCKVQILVSFLLRLQLHNTQELVLHFTSIPHKLLIITHLYIQMISQIFFQIMIIFVKIVKNTITTPTAIPTITYKRTTTLLTLPTVCHITFTTLTNSFTTFFTPKTTYSKAIFNLRWYLERWLSCHVSNITSSVHIIQKFIT